MSAAVAEQAAPELVDDDKTREVVPVPVERWADVVRRGDAYLVDDADFRDDLKWDIEDRR